jgi:calcineurin-like phosphoesterase family protein
MIFFTADLHFGHANIIRHCDRPFASADEMDEALIHNWNSAIGLNDEVYILGDFTMRPAVEAHRYLTQLNGRKYFIRGNHDRFLKGFNPYMSDFEWVKDYHVLPVEGRRLVLFHFPILEWDQFYRNAIHLYGHVHNSQTSAKRLAALTGPAFNVGVDMNNFMPVSIYEIFQKASQV